MPKSLRTAAALALVAILLAACAGRAGYSADPTGAAIEHPTGASDVILRVFVGGGFVPPGFLATEAPFFSLYGDGHLIARVAAPLPTPMGNVYLGAPFQIAKLTEGQVQALLLDALDNGGLRTARAQYELPVADAPSTVFTIDAGGVRKQVAVNGLGIVSPPGADAAAITALADLSTRLRAYAAALPAADPWVAERYRGWLLDAVGDGTPIQWPWSGFTPDDWTNVTDTSASFPFPTRLLSRAEVEALRLGPLAGGAAGIVVAWPNAGGKFYGVSLRPLLPDETS
jgi:hypothetical protein